MIIKEKYRQKLKMKLKLKKKMIIKNPKKLMRNGLLVLKKFKFSMAFLISFFLLLRLLFIVLVLVEEQISSF